MTLHLGTTPWASGPDLSGPPLAQAGELAERAGFESFWLPESHFVQGANPAPLLRLAAVAGRTERIRLGTTSYLLPVRNAIAAAEEVAVLDHLSDGRVILGVGRGFRRALFDVFGVDPAEKRKLLEAALRTMKSAWRGDPIAVPGAEPDAPPIRLEPRPVQQPHPPIWVAAFGPKALAQVGGLGLPYLASPMESRQQLLANHDAHTQALGEAGHRREDVAVPIMRTAFVGSAPEVERVREELRAEAEGWRRLPSPRLRAAADVDVDDRALLGEAGEFRERVARYREELGMTHLIVRPMLSRRPPEEVRRGLDTLREALV
ncbi:MAG: LLM class flavin-dependent oxidoreductase [Acidobacteriota bacterium]